MRDGRGVVSEHCKVVHRIAVGDVAANLCVIRKDDVPPERTWSSDVTIRQHVSLLNRLVSTTVSTMQWQY